jgi:hypothetical protein
VRSNATLGSGHLNLGRLVDAGIRMPRQFVIGIILVLALLAFELFNFDTTRYALEDLLGDVRFAGLAWATILAIAFCAIDFAGLARLFTPERGRDEPKEIWYLTGAWLLGATMNAVMTWWAVSVTLLSHDLGNEVLSREQLLHIVPIFVAILVWLTRILFIGAITMAGERLLTASRSDRPPTAASGPSARSSSSQPNSATAGASQQSQHNGKLETIDLASPPRSNVQGNSRVRQRPPRPMAGFTRAGRQARPSSGGR